MAAAVDASLTFQAGDSFQAGVALPPSQAHAEAAASRLQRAPPPLPTSRSIVTSSEAVTRLTDLVLHSRSLVSDTADTALLHSRSLVSDTADTAPFHSRSLVSDTADTAPFHSHSLVSDTADTALFHSHSLVSDTADSALFHSLRESDAASAAPSGGALSVRARHCLLGVCSTPPPPLGRRCPVHSFCMY